MTWGEGGKDKRLQSVTLEQGGQDKRWLSLIWGGGGQDKKIAGCDLREGSQYKRFQSLRKAEGVNKFSYCNWPFKFQIREGYVSFLFIDYLQFSF